MSNLGSVISFFLCLWGVAGLLTTLGVLSSALMTIITVYMTGATAIAVGQNLGWLTPPAAVLLVCVNLSLAVYAVRKMI